MIIVVVVVVVVVVMIIVRVVLFVVLTGMICLTAKREEAVLRSTGPCML